MPLGRFHGVAVFLGDTDTSSRTNGWVSDGDQTKRLEAAWVLLGSAEGQQRS